MANFFNIIPPCKSLSTLGDRSFYMAAPKTMERSSPFLLEIYPQFNDAFKKAFKTRLFQNAFPS